MAKDPAFLFYSNDFLSGTFTMSDEQVGKYIRLLCIQHQKGTLTKKDMLNICKSYDEDIFCKFDKDKNDNYFNIRLKEEYEKRKAYSESRRKNRKSVKKPKSEKTYDEHMEDVNENKDVIKEEDKKEITYPFDSEKFKSVWEQWKLYKLKEFKFKYKSEISEQAALSSLNTLSNNNENIAYAIMKRSVENGWRGFFELTKKANSNNAAAMNDYKQQILDDINATS